MHPMTKNNSDITRYCGKWYRTGREALQGKTHENEHTLKTKGQEAQKAGDHAVNQN